jgi:hypothetical protein
MKGSRYRFDYRNFKITNTLNVITHCWMTAEKRLQRDIRDYRPDANEETITQLFCTQLAKDLRAASDDDQIKQAFLRDMQIAFSRVYRHFLYQIVEGLIADVTLHERHTEGLTGGDLGLVIVRPQIHKDFGHLQIGDYRQGILTQAKLKRYDGKWGRFTKRQQEVLPEKLHYLALLLYSYTDVERHLLSDFQWQLCSSVSFPKVESWLKGDVFPSLLDSADILRRLGNGDIGTDDSRIVDEIIAPEGSAALIITIGWPEGKGPGSQVRVLSRHEPRRNTQSVGKH